MATATVNRVAYLGSTFTPAVIAAIKNGTRTATAVGLSDSVNTEGRPTVGLVGDTGAVFGFIERDISGDVLNPQSVDSNGNVTYNAIGTVKRSGIVRVTKHDTTTGAATAGAVGDIGSGVVGVVQGTAPAGSVGVAATGYGTIIAYTGNDLFVLLD